MSELKYLKLQAPKVKENYNLIKQIEPTQQKKQRGHSITLDILGTYHFRHFQCGFTLLEVMIAMAIIAIALVAVFGSQSQSVSLASEAKFNTTAALLAQSKMAEIETLNPKDLVSGSGDFGEDFPDYHWDVTVSDIVFPGAEEVSGHLKQINLSISYGGHGQHEYRVRLYRFVPKTR